MSERHFIVLAYPDEASCRTAVAAIKHHDLWRYGNDGAACGPMDRGVRLMVETESEVDEIEALLGELRDIAEADRAMEGEQG